MGNIRRFTKLMEKYGYQRVFTPPRFHLYLNYEEALEESQAFVEQEDRNRAEQRKEAMRDVVDAARYG